MEPSKELKKFTINLDESWDLSDWLKQKKPEEAKCISGCKHYYGGEIRHHKDCFYYPESFSKMYDDLELQQEKSYSEEDLKEAYNAESEGWTGFDFWFKKFKKN